MDPSLFGARLASSAVTPLLKKVFVAQGPGADLVDRPLRLSGWLSLNGEKRTLGEQDLRKLTAEVVARAVAATGPHDAPAPEVQREVADALAASLLRLGGLDMDDVQAVRLGPDALARQITQPAALSADADALYAPLLRTLCLHILNFFTQRSTFVARTLVEQAAQIEELITRTDLLLERIPSRTAEDTRFEQRYAEHIARKHGELTIYGLDLNHAREWQLDAAYISLEAEAGGLPLPADRALRGHDRVLLRGNAGCGKTTLVQWLAVTTARQTYDANLTHLLGRVPFVLPLRRVLREGLPPTPDRFLHAVRSSLSGVQPSGWANRVLAAGRGLLLVDGIDEIPEREREETRRWLRELMGDFPGNLWLVTSRPSAVRDDWLAREGFTELTLSPMGRTDIADFVHRWHTAAEADPALADALLTAIRTTSDLNRLATNPLMCGLLCALHRERHGFLPHSRKDLYEAALSMLLERRDVERAIPLDNDLRLSRESQIQLLQKLAHWMIRNDRAEMERPDALAQLTRALTHMAHITATPDQVFHHLLNRSGLLREPAEGRVDFVHRTFQDYLAAKAVVEEGDFPLLIDNAHKAQWEDIIRMAVAHARPAERARILEGIVAPVEDTGDTADGVGVALRVGSKSSGTPLVTAFRNIILALACLEHATELEPALREKIVLLGSRLVPPRERYTARILADEGGPTLLGLLPGPEGLSDEEAAAVVITASRIGGDAALPLLSRYRDHASLRVRRQLIWSWARFDTDEYAAEVVAHLDETDLYFTARNLDHLRALKAMDGRPRIQVFGPYDPCELTEHMNADRLTHLWLTEGYTTSDGEAWLTAFPHLHTLLLPDRPPLSEAHTIPGHITVICDVDPGDT